MSDLKCGDFDASIKYGAVNKEPILIELQNHFYVNDVQSWFLKESGIPDLIKVLKAVHVLYAAGKKRHGQ